MKGVRNNQIITSKTNQKRCIALHTNWKEWSMLKAKSVFMKGVRNNQFITAKTKQKGCIVLHINWKIWSMS